MAIKSCCVCNVHKSGKVMPVFVRIITQERIPVMITTTSEF